MLGRVLQTKVSVSWRISISCSWNDKNEINNICVHLTFSLTWFSLIHRTGEEQIHIKERGKTEKKSKASAHAVLQASLPKYSFLLWLIAESWNTKAGKRRLIKTYPIHWAEIHVCELQQNTLQDMENLSLCLSFYLTLLFSVVVLHSV